MIKISNITKEYRLGEQAIRALDGVSVKIEDGEFVSILGPSGSGKSTLMHIIGGLDHPATGKVEVGGRDLSRLSDRSLAHFRNATIGFVFQSFFLIPQISALENVTLPLIYSGGREKRRERAAAALKMVGLGERMRNRPNQLSGGEQQRVAIARALVNEPEIILADEPTGNLDSKTTDEIVDLLQGLNKKGRTLIIVTHEQEIADRADRIVHVRDGKIV